MKTCFCSWSGGKDSCLALYRAIAMGYDPKFLLTTFLEAGKRSRSHGLAIEILQAQAASIGLPLVCCNTSWADYRNNFVNTLERAQHSIAEVTTGIFGDIDIIAHRGWVEAVSSEVGCEGILPLWQCDREELLTEFLELGFEAKIVAVADGKVDSSYLGCTIDTTVIAELIQLGIDPCGENGEYHTVVVAGPMFTKPLNIIANGGPQLRSGYWYQDFCLQ